MLSRSRTDAEREVFGWQMYDWGWSAFSTTVTTALLGPYFFELTEDQGGMGIAGFTVDAASIFPFTVSLSAVLQVIALPLIGAMADHTDHKKRLMLGLAYAASAATAGLFLLTATTVLLGAALFVVAAVGFGAAGALYHSYLADIAAPEDRDRVSSDGFAYGYLGGGLWLAANFALIALMDDTGLAVRICLGGSGLWAGFFIWRYTARHLRARPAARSKPADVGWLPFSVGSVVATAKEMWRNHPVTFRYLLSYLMFNDGILTVIAVATTFAADELDAEPSTLLALILLIQFVAVPGSAVTGRLAAVHGSKRVLIATLLVWTALVIYAYVDLDSITKLWVMGAVLAFVLGGSQSISRSLFAQMIPADREAEYFGFYEISSRGTSWLGPLIFGVVNQITGSQQEAIIALIVFFVVGIVLLIPIDIATGMRQAGQDPAGVRL